MNSNTYTEDEVREETLKYFDGDELATNVFITKYALRNKSGALLENSPRDMHKRLAREFSRIEQQYHVDDERTLSYDNILEYLGGFRKIVPQGSPMYGIGNREVLSSLSNCVVVGSPEDNISSIMDAGKDLANLFKRRCGVGIDLSNLRPEHTPVNNAAGTTTGAWSFADHYSNVCRMIGQNGRRGALMISLDIRHPDAFKFATMKNDLTKVTGANISFRIYDDFMYAVRDDEEYDLHWPCGDPNPLVKKRIRARDLWDTLISSATNTAEPGILMWDNILRRLPAHNYPEFFTITVNPCMTGDTWVHTIEGPKQIVDLVGSKRTLLVNGEPVETEGFFSTGKQLVFRVDTAEGYSFKATAEHKFLTPDGWQELKDLKPGDTIQLSEQHHSNGWKGDGGTYEEGWLVGSVVGGGTFGKHGATVDFWGETAEQLANYATDCIKSLPGAVRSDWQGATRVSDHLRVQTKTLETLCERYLERLTKNLKPSVEMASSEFYGGFLNGLFGADGSVQGTPKKGVNVGLAQSSYKRLQIVQRMLSRLGMSSSIYERRPAGVRPLPDGYSGLKEYWYKTQYELMLSKADLHTMELVLSGSPRGDELSEKLKLYKREPYAGKNTARIAAITASGMEEVYDVTVPSKHEFDANGVRSHNCGEITLSAYDSCRLISMNLKWLVKDPFTRDARIDFDELKDMAHAAVRLSDDLVELELEKLEKIKAVTDTPDEAELWSKLLNAAERGRRIGLGTHGLADLLARMGILYDSPRAVELVDEIYKTIKHAAFKASIELAKERGPFPAFNWELEKDNEYIQELPEEIRVAMAKHGRRNVGLLTNAPTGSVSIESQTSSGLEAFYRLELVRRRKLSHNDDPSKAVYTDDMGDMWEEYKVRMATYQEFLDAGYSPENAKDFFVTADQIDWKMRIEIQAAIQKHIDHSISSTINLPRGTSKDVVSELYMLGWEKGLKGVTVYVDGSRDGVLLDTSEKQPQGRSTQKRPEVLECDIHQVQVKGERYTIFVGMLDGRPYEVMGGLADKIYLPADIKSGHVKKIPFKTRPARYDLYFNSEGFIRDVVKTFDNPEYSVHTRMISLSLRHGAKPSYVIEQLQKGDRDSDLWSFSKVLSRVLKKYIEDGTEVTGDKHCPECDGNHLVYEEGCVTCKDCGYAKCG